MFSPTELFVFVLSANNFLLTTGQWKHNRNVLAGKIIHFNMLIYLLVAFTLLTHLSAGPWYRPL